MTCVVGCKGKGKVYIGADSIASDGYSNLKIKQPKVFYIGKNKEFLIGYTTSFRMGQLLQYSFNPPKHDPKVAVHAYMSTVFVEELRKLYKDNGFSKITENNERGGQCLVAYKGKLFEIESDFAVLETIDVYNAIGCGCNYALGSMFSSTNEPEIYKRIELALNAASAHCALVSGPINILKHTVDVI